MAERQPETVTFSSKHYLVIRRLHSLTGIIPVGVFLCFHLLANASVLVPGTGGAEFQKSVDRIHALGPLLVPVEIVGIFIPILFHAILGLQITFTGESNSQQYRYGGNIRYTLQRISGVIALLFIVYHVWQMHWLGAPFGGGKFAAHDQAGAAAAARTTAEVFRAGWWISPIYAIGVIACVYHLANGIWTALITWGITIRPPTQRAAGYVCAVFGVVLSLAGLGALRGFKTLTLDEGVADTPAHGVTAVAHGDRSGPQLKASADLRTDFKSAARLND